MNLRKTTIQIAGFIFAVQLNAYAQVPLVNPEAAPVPDEARIAAARERLDYHPNAAAVSIIVRTLQRAKSVTPELKDKSTALLKESSDLQAARRPSEARRPAMQAAALLLGQSWTPHSEYVASLVLRPSVVVADSGVPLVMQLSQAFPADHKATSRLQLKIAIVELPNAAALDNLPKPGKVVREMGTVSVEVRDLIDAPFRFDVNLDGIADGSYVIAADASIGGDSPTRIVAPIYVLSKLAERRADVDKRLAKIKGHDSTKASILFPFTLAYAMNGDRREVVSIDYPDEIARSYKLLKALEAGKDLLYQAKGDNRRAYWLEEAQDYIPYRVFVPSSWDKNKSYPLVVGLHGGNLDENNFIIRADGLMKKTAEKNNTIVVAPLGYRLNVGYGRSILPNPDEVSIRNSQLSEKDVLSVMERVAKEYNVDRKRIYLMGNSMGGAGTWYLGAMQTDIWAAIVPSAASTSVGTPGWAVIAYGPGDGQDHFPYEKLKGMPIMAVGGELDLTFTSDMKASIEKFKAVGVDVNFVEVKGGTHGSAIEIALPQVFEFYSKHHR